jgi:hypothetical protein
MIKLKSTFLGVVILAQLPLLVFAADQCLSGNPGNNHLVTQLAQAKTKSAISSELFKKYNLDQTPQADPPLTTCVSCQQGPGSQPLNKDNQTTAEIMRRVSIDGGLLLRADCLNAAGQTDTTTSELKCPEGTSSSKYNFCFNQDMSRYQNAAITDFYKCVKKLTNFPLSPAALFEMYSLESGFKPHFAYEGGVGMGQLTGIFVADINQKHRGFNILKKVADSADPDCNIAKKIATKDTKNPISLSNNRCKFVEYGEGMERNVLYTMIGMANSWEKDIEPLMGTYMEKHKANPDVKRAAELALLNTYGPGGRAAARAAVRRLKKLPPKEFINKIGKPMYGTRGQRNLTGYIEKMKKRQQEITKVMTPAQRKAHNTQGAQSCVNN